MRLVSKESWEDYNLSESFEGKSIQLAKFHYKTSYYNEQGNLLGFYEVFPNLVGEMVSIYFRTQTL